MKTRTLLAGAVLLALPAVAAAQPGGFRPQREMPVTPAAEVKELPNDAWVRLRGRIVRALGDEDYEFRDDSGMVVVEIDDEDWGGLVVGPEDRVELYGEIDRHLFGRVEVDVVSVKRVS